MAEIDRLKGKAVPVIRMHDPENARAAVSWLREGGLEVFEITATVPGFEKLIADLASQPGLFVGAGTILDGKSAAAAIDAGARFIVSPCIVPEVMETCARAGIPVLPGAATPTEALTAHRVGASVVKVFPARQLGGAAYLAALRSVFPDIPLMPTGGIGLEDAPAYFKAGAVAVGMGGQLVAEDDVKAGRREEIVSRAARLRQLGT
jgi:2-dehydro-3-deoxyphosphogluconate aldolase/(4S)-4-hydroxy-2-oxoglutarate aldolase